MVIPKDQFSSFQNGQIINQNGLEAIEGIQSNYANWIHLEEILYQILPFLMLLSMLYPLRIIYKSRGKNIRGNNGDGVVFYLKMIFLLLLMPYVVKVFQNKWVNLISMVLQQQFWILLEEGT